MKKLLLLILPGLLLFSCNYRTGSGNIISESRETGNFDAVSISGGFDTEIKTGPGYSVLVEADDNIMRYIEVETRGNTLKIYTEGLNSYNNVYMKVYITAPAINKIKASASAEVVVSGILSNSGNLNFNASSGAAIKAEVDAPVVSSDVSSGAEIILNGRTKTYEADASSGSEIDSWNLLSENTTVQVSSGASAKVHASVKLNAKASSGASVTYHGAAVVNQSVSSGGGVSKKG